MSIRIQGNTVIDDNRDGSLRSLTVSNSVSSTVHNSPTILSAASGSTSAGASIAIQQQTTEGWTGIFCDFEPYTGWGFWHDNPNNYFSFTSEGTTGQIRSFTVPSRQSGNRTAYEKFRIDQNNGNIIVGGTGTAQSDFRAPIFYDSNNTAYYVDPAGGNARIGRDIYVEGGTGGSFGNRLIVGGTTTPYTLQDTNRRPTVYIRGAYPVVTLDHTVTTNSNHGPTIQFTFNGYTSNRQILIGTDGQGQRLDFGFSGGSYGTNTNFNPHNGIAGYQGLTPMRLFSNGLLLGSTGVYPNEITGTSYALDVRGTGFSSSDFRAPIFYDSNNTSYYVDPNSTSNIWRLQANDKYHYFGASTNWDLSGTSNLTNVHFQGHPRFWMGAGNAYWWRGAINTEHDLLITTMQGYSNTSYYRGITFAVDNNGNANSGYRLGRWQTYNTTWNTARLYVDASLAVGYGSRGIQGSDVANWPVDRGVWTHGANQPDTGGVSTGYGDSRIRSRLFSPNIGSHSGGPWGSFASLEVSSVNDNNADIPALFRIHQWGSGSAEFWKPRGTTLFLRESPISGSIKHGNWFTRFLVQRYIESDESMRAPIFYDSNDTTYYIDPNTSGNSLNIRGVIRTTANTGSVLMKHAVSEANAWLFQENAANWGIYWFNTGAQSGAVVGQYTTVGAETFGFRNGSIGNAFNPPDSWSGVNSSTYATWMLSNYNGYFWTANTQYSAQDMRAPIFYDANNTAFYVNPNSESRQQRVRIGPYAGSVSNANVTGLELVNNGGTGDNNVAAMSFHCSGTYAIHMHLRNDSYFGIGGWSASAWRWYVQTSTGNMTAAGNVTAFSDPRLKEDITKIESPLDRISKLNGVKFRWKDNSVIGMPGSYDYGVLANEVEEKFPELVHGSAHKSPDGDEYKTVAYDKLIPVLIEAIKEQQEIIEKMNKRLEELEKST